MAPEAHVDNTQCSIILSITINYGLSATENSYDSYELLTFIERTGPGVCVRNDRRFERPAVEMVSYNGFFVN